MFTIVVVASPDLAGLYVSQPTSGIIVLSTSNSTLNVNTQEMSFSEIVAIKCQMHLEYRTYRLIGLDVKESMSYQYNGQNTSLTVSTQMTLVRDVKP